ncbi:MAG: hypothetical protein U1E61_21315 [Bradyrhizobium sp.]
MQRDALVEMVPVDRLRHRFCGREPFRGILTSAGAEPPGLAGEIAACAEVTGHCRRCSFPVSRGEGLRSDFP